MESVETKDALHLLKSLGVIRVSVDFDGGGDSGQMNNIEVEGISNQPELIPLPSEFLEKHYSGAASYNTPKNLLEFIDAWAYDLLDETNYDWVNNDGGYGEIIVVPGDDSIRVNMNQRFTSSQLIEFDYSKEAGALEHTATHPPREE